MNLQNKKITLKQFKRSITCQEYFIWNDFDENNEKTELNSANYELENNDFWSVFKNDEKSIQDFFSDSSTTINPFKKMREAFNTEFSKGKKNKKIFYLKQNEVDVKIAYKATMNAINSKKYDFIMNPVFIYKNAIAKPSLYDINNKKLSEIKLTHKTKKSDYIRCFYNYNIATKSILINDYSIYLIKTLEKTKKMQIEFIETKKINFTINGRSCKKPILDYKKCSDIVIGNNEKYTIMDFVNEDKFMKTYANKAQILKNKFEKIDFYIKKIEKARLLKKRQKVSMNDLQFWGENPFITNLLNIDYPNESKFSGILNKKKQILENNLPPNEFRDEIFNKNIKYDLNKVQDIIKPLRKTNNRIIWYDFESLSMPYPVLDGYPSLIQIVFQVSIIETINDKIVDVQNLVFDPSSKKTSNQHFIKIINAIYANKADAFVVFNKSYENTRISEMIENLETHIPEKILKPSKLMDIKDRAHHIIKNTVDLADLFKGSLKKIPPLLVPELYGYFSIKKIEKYINNSGIKLQEKISPYKKLAIKNGLLAMEVLIMRFSGAIGDQEWKLKERQLKEYCENDVRAMIMVYHFVIYTINNY